MSTGKGGAIYCSETKGLLFAQPLPQPEESLCKQQAFGDLLCKASCLQFAALLQNLDTTLCSCLVLQTNLGPFRVSLPPLPVRGTT